jgi:hypothetical protein
MLSIGLSITKETSKEPIQEITKKLEEMARHSLQFLSECSSMEFAEKLRNNE